MTMDRASWQVQDSDVLGELIVLMELSAQEAALLGALHDQAREAAPRMAEVFYQRLLKHPNTAEYLQSTSMEQRHALIGQWFVDLFGGTYDVQYAEKRLIIGRVHVRIGLPVRYPLAMIDVVLKFGEQVALKSTQPEAALAAFRKVLALDIGIFNQAYENNQLMHLAEMVGGERLARRLLTGAV